MADIEYDRVASLIRVIANETVEGENTATRVGTTLLQMLNYTVSRTSDLSWDDLKIEPTQQQLVGIIKDYYVKNDKSFVKSLLGISDWALAANKPSYQFSEIEGKVASEQLPDLYWANIHVANEPTTAAEPSFGKIIVGGVTIDVVNGKLRIGGDVYATGGVSAYGEGIDTPTGVSSFAELSEVAAAGVPGNGQVWGWNGTRYGWLTVGGGGASDWNELNGRPLWLDSMIAQKPTVSAWRNDAGYLTEHQSLADYLKKSDAESLYQPIISDLSTIRGNASHGNTAYGWGNHAEVGYLTEHQSLVDYLKKSDAVSLYQPIISDLSTIRNNASNGNTAYGWGNHADVGYLTSVSWDAVKPSQDELLATLGKLYCGNLSVGKNPSDSEIAVFAGTIVKNGNSMTTAYGGHLDIKDSTPYIDFYGNYGGSFTSRIIDAGSGVLTMLGNGIQVGSWNAPIIRWDAAKNAYCIEGNVFATGGISAYGGLGSYSDVELNSLTVRGKTKTNELNIGNTRMWTDGDDWIYFNHSGTYVDASGEVFFNRGLNIGYEDCIKEVSLVNNSKLKIVIAGITRYITLQTS